MLEDFIESNNLTAKIHQGIKSFNLIQCTLFFSDSLPVLTISIYGDKLDWIAVKKAMDSKQLDEVTGKKVEEVTGYKDGFVPPISIYGIKVLADEKIMKLDTVNVLIEEEVTLTIPPNEIKEFNEEFLEEKITQ